MLRGLRMTSSLWTASKESAATQEWPPEGGRDTARCRGEVGTYVEQERWTRRIGQLEIDWEIGETGFC